MPRAGFEPTISSLLVTRLTNLAIKACFYLEYLVLIIDPSSGSLFIFLISP